MYKNKKLGLCKGRHNIEGVTEYVFPQEVNPLDLNKLAEMVHEALADCTKLDLYVTGLTVALVEVINYATKNNIALTLWHYNRDTGEYYSQSVATDYWQADLKEGGYI